MEFHACVLSDEVLQELRLLDQIETLVLHPGGNNVSLSIVDGMKSLQVLIIQDAAVDLDAFADLVEPPSLVGLALENVALQGNLSSLSTFPFLKVLSLNQSALSPEELRPLKNLTSVRIVSYLHNPVTDEHRALFHGLREVTVSTWPSVDQAQEVFGSDFTDY
jgi:hypothetical protein